MTWGPGHRGNGREKGDTWLEDKSGSWNLRDRESHVPRNLRGVSMVSKPKSTSFTLLGQKWGTWRSWEGRRGLAQLRVAAPGIPCPPTQERPPLGSVALLRSLYRAG